MAHEKAADNIVDIIVDIFVREFLYVPRENIQVVTAVDRA
jgi:hypothetical protein